MVNCRVNSGLPDVCGNYLSHVTKSSTFPEIPMYSGVHGHVQESVKIHGHITEILLAGCEDWWLSDLSYVMASS